LVSGIPVAFAIFCFIAEMPNARLSENDNPGILIVIYDKQRATINNIAPKTKKIKLKILPKQPYFLLTPIPAQKTRATIANATLSGATKTIQQAMIISSVSSIVYLQRLSESFALSIWRL